MKRYILTGAPGAGKTSIIEKLKENGEFIVPEAATDLIFQKQNNGCVAPWEEKKFLDEIVKIQKSRQLKKRVSNSSIHFYDRSPICTYALSVYLGFKQSKCLLNEIKRILDQQIYEKKVFFIKNLGFVENNNVRKITFEESIKFEQMHIDAYQKFGYDLKYIPKDSIDQRVRMILSNI